MKEISRGSDSCSHKVSLWWILFLIFFIQAISVPILGYLFNLEDYIESSRSSITGFLPAHILLFNHLLNVSRWMALLVTLIFAYGLWNSFFRCACFLIGILICSAFNTVLGCYLLFLVKFT
jgi:hypothetical protein